MPGGEGLLLKRSTSSYRKKILSDLYYGKVLDHYVSTTLIKYLLRKMYWEQLGFSLHSSAVVVLD